MRIMAHTPNRQVSSALAVVVDSLQVHMEDLVEEAQDLAIS